VKGGGREEEGKGKEGGREGGRRGKGTEGGREGGRRKEGRRGRERGKGSEFNVPWGLLRRGKSAQTVALGLLLEP